MKRPRQRVIRRIAAALAGLLVLAAAVAGGLWLYAPHWRPSTSTYPRQGIDVSHYQGRIDWPGLPVQGVNFAYIKASEGGDLRDPTFAVNWAGAHDVGIARGAYHYFSLCRSGADQAANFIAAVPVAPDALPPAVDLEDNTDCPNPVTPASFRAELATFIRLVEARYGKPMLLYLTREFDSEYQVSAHVDRPLWLRSILTEPDFGARPFTMWQASDFRRLEGIRGKVDWNAARP
jgi:lysozyme